MACCSTSCDQTHRPSDPAPRNEGLGPLLSPTSDGRKPYSLNTYQFSAKFPLSKISDGDTILEMPDLPRLSWFWGKSNRGKGQNFSKRVYHLLRLGRVLRLLNTSLYMERESDDFFSNNKPVEGRDRNIIAD